MNRHAIPKWILSADWGIDTDSFNWILYRKRGERWTANGFYPSVESLLQSLYKQLTRTEPANPDLIKHVEGVSERVAACAAALFTQLEARDHTEKKAAFPTGGVRCTRVN
jgi:hypothetical protein